MRDLGHEKNSQHVFIKSVILRESFLSGTIREKGALCGKKMRAKGKGDNAVC